MTNQYEKLVKQQARLIQKGALLEKYFQADNLSVEKTEELLKMFADYVNAHKPNKLKNDQANN